MAFARTTPALVLLVLLSAAASADEPNLSAADQLPPIEYLYEAVHVRGNVKTGEAFFESLLGIDPGERVGIGQLDRFRRQLLRTGFFSRVETRLAPGSRPEAVVVEVEVEERNTILIHDVFLGFSADTTLWGGLDLAETNLLGTGLLLAGAFVLSDDQRAVRVNLADPYGALLLPFSWHLELRWADLVGGGPARDDAGLAIESAFEAQRLGGLVGIGWRPVRILHLGLDYRLEGLELTHVGPAATRPWTGIPEGSSRLSNLGLRVSLDFRDRPRFSRRGFQLGGVAEGGGRFTGSDYTYVALAGWARSSIWLGRGHILRLELGGGALWAEEDRAPYFDGFYIGDLSEWVADRDLDVQFTDRRSLDLFGTGADLVTYADGFGRLRTEWAYELDDVFGPFDRVEAFLAVSLLALDQGPWDIGRPPEAVTRDPVDRSGLRFDLTADVGVRAETPVGFFGLSFGSLASLAPLN